MNKKDDWIISWLWDDRVLVIARKQGEWIKIGDIFYIQVKEFKMEGKRSAITCKGSGEEIKSERCSDYVKDKR